ncbi:hypothetical protein A3J33_02270 [candidate division WWE3 bacterium RIFCSPLOWO2_02_FULL_53_10]|uniref:Uncharacterized protein n=2 Tax=Katanobacteria TaxID=422282 RepID=A0A1F4WBG5_UNCKA|nr:MAG: hypothetical protein A2890_00590 [candidate division WWE3 bacterium RIFCSPLOWO2_01_FULL_53_14]OGC66716.1 MAG: hypothetical protein A3J33_02270 [candidate division WWE3 bacterium RIFCSPLOWO2_02_FULL_53_10]
MISRHIPAEHVKLVCKIGQGQECCRYLLGSPEGFECGKGGGFTELLNERAVNNSMAAQGDNCEGLYQLSPAESEDKEVV